MAKFVSHFQAIIYAFMGFTLWVFSDAALKLTSEANVPPQQIVAILGFFIACTMVLKVAPQKGLQKLWPKNPLIQGCRSLLCVGNTACGVIAFKHLPLTLFYVIVFMCPMVISILAAFFLKEKLSPTKILALIVGFIGVVIAVDPFGSDMRGDWIGYVATLGSVFFYSINVVWLRVMTQSETTDSLTFFMGLVQAIVGLAAMMINHVPMTWEIWLFLLIAGVFSAVGNLFGYTALKHTAAATVSQFQYTQIITGALLGYFIWHDTPTFHLILGAVVIISSGLYIASHTRRAEILARFSGASH